MSHPDVMIGYIEEPSWTNASFAWHEANDAVLAQLPLEDAQYPPVQRSMFCAPSFSERKLRFGASRVISFAIHGNFFHDALNLWLTKFEPVLRQMYWAQVRIHMDGDYMRYAILYRPTPQAVKLMSEPIPHPVNTWVFRCVDPAGFTTHWLKEYRDRPGFTDEPQFVTSEEHLARLRGNIRSARELVAGRAPQDFDSDECLVRALHHIALDVRHCVTNIGSRVRDKYPAVDWHSLYQLYWFKLDPVTWRFPIANFGDTVGKHLASELEKIEKQFSTID